MQIKNNLQNLGGYTKLEQAEKNNAARIKAERGDSAQASTSSGDTSTVSTEAKLRAEAYSSAISTPDARTEKVDAIKALVNNGEYQIDTKKIALKLLREDSELLGL